MLHVTWMSCMGEEVTNSDPKVNVHVEDGTR